MPIATKIEMTKVAITQGQR